jgi:hypothetical protein
VRLHIFDVHEWRRDGAPVTNHDPYRHWDGQKWHQWNGAAWVAESQHTISQEGAAHRYDPTGAAAPGSPPTKSRRLWLLAGVGVVVIAGIVLAIVLTSGSDNSSDSSGNSDAGNGGITDRNTACKVEVNALVDLAHNGGGTTAVLSLIGYQNPQFQLSQTAFADFEGMVANYGTSDAENRIASKISQACARAGDPLLTRAQVSDLANVASPDDANYLNEVQVFG